VVSQTRIIQFFQQNKSLINKELLESPIGDWPLKKVICMNESLLVIDGFKLILEKVKKQKQKKKQKKKK
jgi:TRAP-type mannitol/chloroaromatic compound transport system permease small subunit